MHKLLVTAFAVGSSVSLAGCETMTTDFGGTSDAPPLIGRAAFCDVAKPISWSRNDSDATIVQVKEHNAAGKSICGWS